MLMLVSSKNTYNDNSNDHHIFNEVVYFPNTAVLLAYKNIDQEKLFFMNNYIHKI